MDAKIVYAGGLSNDTYFSESCDEGFYHLILDNKIIGSWFCSNRSWANVDLTEHSLETLNKYNINRVYSNNELVWEAHDN